MEKPTCFLMCEDHRSSQSILGEGGQANEHCNLKSVHWMTQFHTLLGFFVSSFRAHVWRWSRSRWEILTTAGRWWRRGRSVSCAPSGRWWERWFGWFCRDPSRQPECRSDCCCTGTPSTPGPGPTQHTVTQICAWKYASHDWWHRSRLSSSLSSSLESAASWVASCCFLVAFFLLFPADKSGTTNWDHWAASKSSNSRFK